MHGTEINGKHLREHEEGEVPWDDLTANTDGLMAGVLRRGEAGENKAKKSKKKKVLACRP